MDVVDEYLTTLEMKEFMHSFAIGLVRQYVFKHALTQEVAYETLLKRDRRDIQDRVGQAIEDLFAQAREEQVELLAHHFLRAENWEKAWTYHIQAGRKAWERFANQEALAFLGTAKPTPPTTRVRSSVGGRRMDSACQVVLSVTSSPASPSGCDGEGY